MSKEIPSDNTVTVHLWDNSRITGRYAPVRISAGSKSELTPLGYHITGEKIDAVWKELYGQQVIGIIEIFSTRNCLKPKMAGLYFGLVQEREWFEQQISFFEQEYHLGINRVTGKGARWLSFFIVDPD